MARFLSLCDNCFRGTYVWRSMIINNEKIINVGENNRQPRLCYPFYQVLFALSFFFYFFYFLMFTFHNLWVWISNNNSHQIATFILVGYSFVNSYRTYSERPNQLSLLTVRQFHTSVDQRIEVWNNRPFMKIAFNMQIFWGNLVKQFVDSLEESSLYFLKDKKSTSAKNRVRVKEVKI